MKTHTYEELGEILTSYLAREEVKRIAKQVVHGRGLSWQIDCIKVEVSPEVVFLRVEYTNFGSLADTQKAHQLLKGVSSEIVAAAGGGARSLQISMSERREHVPSPLCSGARADDDDDSDYNPNWPSKTGNPSGGGRGNNPPGR